MEVKDNLLWHSISSTLLPVLNFVWKTLPVSGEHQFLFRGVTLNSLHDLNRFIPNIEDNSTLTLIPQRRGSLKNLSAGSHLFECSLSFILLLSKFYPPTTQTFQCLIPQRRGSLKNLSEGSHLFECSLSFILLISKFDPPTTQTFRRLIVWVWLGWGVVWCGVGRIYLFDFFFINIEVFFSFFLKCL